MSHVSRISVAMCTYNGSRFLPEQLASIAAQTRLPDEVVICDDGSTDSTPSIVADFAASASFPVRWFRNPENLGSTKNFEQAIALCSGDLIVLSDQDDIWMPDKLERQAAMFERDPALGGVFSDAEVVDENSQPIGVRLWEGFRFPPAHQDRFRKEGAVSVLLKWNVVTGATLMIRADLRDLFWPIPACWHHDGWIAWMVALYSKLDFIEEPLVRYRRHSDQQVGVPQTRRSRNRPPLIERLKNARRREPPIRLMFAREIDELARRLAARSDVPDPKIIRQLRSKFRFVESRGRLSKSRTMRILIILKNARNYHRFESGWKCMVGDLMMGLLPNDKES